MTLTQESPGSDKGIGALERAAASLYKALQAIRETGLSALLCSAFALARSLARPDVPCRLCVAVGDMQAAMERSGEYESYNAQFCKRLSDYMAILFKFQVRPCPILPSLPSAVLS